MKQIEGDLRARCDEVPAIDELLKMEYDQARKAELTGVAFEEWRADLITQVAVAWVLSCVFVRFLEDNRLIDTSLAYIPGHGTPTVILLGRNRSPISPTLRAVMGIKREDNQPDDPAQGLVWSAILHQVDKPGSESEFVSVVDSPGEAFHKHPWSIGGGGAAELKEHLEENTSGRLDAGIDSIGFASFTGQDDAFVADRTSLARSGVPIEYVKQFVVGDTVRDWTILAADHAFAPYDSHFDPIELSSDAAWARWMWPMRTVIGSVVSFGGKTRLECGDNWWTWYRWIPEKYRTPLSITFAFVATHNHFVLDRGGKVFKQSTPVIKLPPDATEDDHLALLGLLNSSTGAFWLRQSCHDKGGGGIGGGIAAETWERFLEYTGTKLQQFPLPEDRPLELACRLDELTRELQATTPREILTRRREGAKRNVTDDLSAFA